MTCPCMLGQGGGYRRGRTGQGGGYRPTRRNRNLLHKYRAGKSIGFTAKASLKSKGMLPRSNGRYVLGSKYSKNGAPRVLKHAITRRRR
jgi:hypothetical protein